MLLRAQNTFSVFTQQLEGLVQQLTDGTLSSQPASVRSTGSIHKRLWSPDISMFLHVTSFSFTAKFLDIKDVLNPKCFPYKQVVEWPHYQSGQLFTDHRRCSHTARRYTAESSRSLFLCDVCQLQLPLTFISVSRLGGLPQCKPGSLAHKGSGDGEWQSPAPASQMVTRPRCRLYTRSPPQTETYEWNRHTDGFIQHSWEDSFNKMMFLWFLDSIRYSGPWSALVCSI